MPAPGGPVIPTTWAAGSPPSAAGETSASSALVASLSARFSITFSAAGAAERSPSRSLRPSSVGSVAIGARR